MRTALGSFVTFIIGLIIGAAALWIAAYFVVIPGIKTSNNNTQNTGQSAQTQNGTNNQRNQTLASTQQLINGFPNDVPIYQPSSLNVSTKSTRGGNVVTYSASYTSSNPADDIVNYYTRHLNSGDWHIDNQSQNNGVTVIKAIDKNNRQIDVLITRLSSQAGNIQSGYQLAVTPAS